MLKLIPPLYKITVWLYTIEFENSKIEELSIINIDEEKAKLSNNSLKEEYNKNLIRIKKEIEELTVRENPDDLLIVKKYKDLDFEDNKNKEYGWSPIFEYTCFSIKTSIKCLESIERIEPNK